MLFRSVENWDVVARDDDCELLRECLRVDIDLRRHRRGRWEHFATSECVEPLKPMIKRRDRDLRRQLVGEVVNNATEGVKHCDRMSFLRWQEARGEGKRVGVVVDDTVNGQIVGSGHLDTLGCKTTQERSEPTRTLPVGNIAVNASRRDVLNWSDR